MRKRFARRRNKTDDVSAASGRFRECSALDSSRKRQLIAVTGSDSVYACRLEASISNLYYAGRSFQTRRELLHCPLFLTVLLIHPRRR